MGSGFLKVGPEHVQHALRVVVCPLFRLGKGLKWGLGWPTSSMICGGILKTGLGNGRDSRVVAWQNSEGASQVGRQRSVQHRNMAKKGWIEMGMVV